MTERESLIHLRDDAPHQVCNGCGRKSWAEERSAPCGMPQPDGTRCSGTFHDPLGTLREEARRPGAQSFIRALRDGFRDA